MSTWEQPTISVDVVPYVLEPKTRELKIALGKREFEPFRGSFALPGVLMISSERAFEAAQRAITTKLHADTKVQYIKDIGISDIPGRDSRGPSLTIILMAVITLPEDYDTATVKLVNPKEAVNLELPFDHHNLIVRTNHFVEQNVLTDQDFTQKLLGETFTTRDVASVMEEVKSEAAVLDKTNLSRKIKSLGYASVGATVEPTVATRSMNHSVAPVSSGKGRPSSMWITNSSRPTQ